MTQSRQHPDTNTAATPAAANREAEGMSKSMHTGIAVWCDCCSCEMEPYWEEVARESGMVPSDHAK